MVPFFGLSDCGIPDHTHLFFYMMIVCHNEIAMSIFFLFVRLENLLKCTLKPTHLAPLCV